MKTILPFIALAFMNFSSFSQVIYVNKNATGANNGSSWSDAYTNLVAVFANAPSGSTIWIAGGTYKTAPDSRSNTFYIDQSDLKVYGGFAGTETSVEQRVWGSNETILSGDILNNDSGAPSSSNTTYNDNNYHVVHVGFSGNNLSLDGITIRGGWSNGSTTGFNADGSAIYFENSISKFRLQHCKIVQNACLQGGAISVPSMSGGSDTITVNACEFSENYASYGSGMYLSLNGAVRVINISNCLFANNTATNTSGTNGYAGSSLWIAGYTSGAQIETNISNCTFAKNKDEGSIAGMNNLNRSTIVLSRVSSGSPHQATISNCIFWENTNSGGASAPCISQGNDVNFVSSLLLLHCTDENNFTGLTPDVGSTGNNDANPLFEDSNNGDFSLSQGSPAIDSGDNGKVVGDADIFGNQRIYNGIVDRGAIERVGPSALNNLNADKGFTLYPNPAVSIVQIRTESMMESVLVFNSIGELVLDGGNAAWFSVEGLPAGSYFVRIKTAKGISTMPLTKL